MLLALADFAAPMPSQAAVAAPFQVAQIVRSGGTGSGSTPEASAPAANLGTNIVAPTLAGGPLTRAHNLGFQFSNIAGSGLTYRNWSSSAFGFALSVFPQQETVGGVTKGLLNYGGQLMLPFYNSGTSRLYGLLAGGVGDLPESRDTNIAPGVGADYVLGDQFILNVGVGLSSYTSTPKPGSAAASRSGMVFGYTLGAQFCF
ncbi:MAG: hypothetical protein VKO64_10030 [Candidatus Sericytochromatia bacterium]|nr:hypothetical protein [Candidatus Sericytochromatia bacterium]